MARRRQVRGGLEELIHDPIGSIFDGQFRPGAYGGHGKHVHVGTSNPWLMLALIQWARRRGLSVRENPFTDPVDPVHTEGSWHYRTFPGLYRGKKLGKGADVSGDPAAMRAFFNYARQLASTGVATGGGGGGGSARPTMAPGRSNVSALLAALGQAPQVPVSTFRPSDPRQTLAALSAQSIGQTMAGLPQMPTPDVLTAGTSTLSSELAELRRRLLTV